MHDAQSAFPATLVSRYLAGDCDEQEKLEIERRCAQDPEFSCYVQECRQIWDLASNKLASWQPDTDRAWSSVQNRIQPAMSRKPAAVLALHRRTYVFFIRAAAVLAIVVGIAGAYLILRDRVQSMQLAQAGDHTLKIAFSDCTVVWLNAGSYLRYPEKFSRRARKVELEGEAFFQVTRDPQREFIVQTDHSQTRVLGTRFNLRAFPDEAIEVLTVQEGRVAFANLDKNELILHLGEQAVLHKSDGQLQKKGIEDADYLSWLTGSIKFDAVPLQEVCAALSRIFHVPFTFADAEIKGFRLTASFAGQSLEQIVHVIERTFPISFEPADKGFVIKLVTPRVQLK